MIKRTPTLKQIEEIQLQTEPQSHTDGKQNGDNWVTGKSSLCEIDRNSVLKKEFGIMNYSRKTIKK